MTVFQIPTSLDRFHDDFVVKGLTDSDNTGFSNGLEKGTNLDETPKIASYEGFSTASLGHIFSEKPVKKTFLLIVLLLLGQQSAASILGFQTLELNFENQDEVSAKARWSNKDKLNITSQGIGTSGDPAVVVNMSVV